MKEDLAIVLVNKVNEDGTLSERLKMRLECGLALYKNGRLKKVQKFYCFLEVESDLDMS